MALSGMNSTRILQENLKSVADFRELTDAENAVYPKVVDIFKKSYKVPCTGCNYCLPCPQGINIPGVFSAYNTSYAHGFFSGVMMYSTTAGIMLEQRKGPRLCNGCKKCEKECPQNIDISGELKRVGRRFEKLPLRIGFSAIRKYMRKSKRKNNENSGN